MRLHSALRAIPRLCTGAWRRFRLWIGRRELSVRLLDLAKWEGTANEPGLVIIQIDGLSRPELERAIERGRMPFLKRLRNRKGYQTRTMYAGQPTTTPAALAELFYGVPQAVPAFGFRDHRSGKVVEMFQPGIASRIQAELSQRDEGLLAGGAAYSVIYSGGAEDSSFCPATTGWRNLERASFWQWMLLFVMNVMSLLRICLLAVVELGVAIGDFVRGQTKGHDFWREVLYIPRRLIVNIVLREYLGIGVETDVTRGVPVIHANFLGYDENAHRRGPDAFFAHYALRGIDRAIRRIWDAAHASRRRRYQVWVMSDHGQEHVVPYPHQYGRSISAAIRDVYDHVQQEASPEEFDREEESYLDELRDWTLRAKWFWKNRIENRHSNADAPPAKPHRPVTVAVGPLGFVYWPEEIPEGRIAEIAERIVAEANIPIVMAKVGDQVMAWTESGRYRMPEHAAEVIGRDHPFREQVAEDFSRLCDHPDAGEFVISGWRPHDPPLSFISENGAHGGPGILETQAFVMLPPDAQIPQTFAAPFRLKTLRSLALRVLGRTAAVQESVESAASEAGEKAMVPQTDV